MEERCYVCRATLNTGDVNGLCWVCAQKIAKYNAKDKPAASVWRTYAQPLEQAPEIILAQTALTGGDTAFVLLDTVGVEIFGKQEWHLYEHNTDRRFYGKIVAWALIHPYEGVE